MGTSVGYGGGTVPELSGVRGGLSVLCYLHYGIQEPGTNDLKYHRPSRNSTVSYLLVLFVFLVQSINLQYPRYNAGIL